MIWSQTYFEKNQFQYHSVNYDINIQQFYLLDLKDYMRYHYDNFLD